VDVALMTEARRGDDYYEAYAELRRVLLDIRSAAMFGEDIEPHIARGLEVIPAHWREMSEDTCTHS